MATDTSNIDFKMRLFHHCVTIIQQRIDTAAQAMQGAQEAANSEEKSSAGDKYETSRAMGHLQKDMYARQLGANRLEMAALLGIAIPTLPLTAARGCIVETGTGLFFIAAGLGKIIFDGKAVYILSPDAPVAKALLGKVAGGKIIFNDKETVIKNIY